MTVSAPALLVLGFFLGMRHATDADHVVAVTTIVCRQRGLRGAMALGAFWGLGHTVTILIVGGAIILFGAVIPPRLGLSLEMAVAAMLILLGALNLRRPPRPARDGVHVHAQAPTSRPPAWRPLAIGVVHGLAGSAAVALLVLTTIREPVWAIAYLAIFGVGTVLGMMVLTTVMTMPLTAASRRFGSVERVAAKLTGALSLAFGLFLAYRLGIIEGLFTGTPRWTPH
jgi:high-affinity nickel-transport protein